MSDTDLILKALNDHQHAMNLHRDEVRSDIKELRDAVVKVADAAAEMGKTMAASEARHMQHEDASKRMGRQLDDHESRIRLLEHDRPDISECRKHAEQIEKIRDQLTASRGSVTGGWKVLTVMGALIVGIVSVATALIKVAV
jgi:septal ring factor EnvC (AmiA/AmiB activator)